MRLERTATNKKELFASCGKNNGEVALYRFNLYHQDICNFDMSMTPTISAFYVMDIFTISGSSDSKCKGITETSENVFSLLLIN